jgi:hypothetical protein
MYEVIINFNMPKDILNSRITLCYNSLLSCCLALYSNLTPLNSPSSEAVNPLSSHQLVTGISLWFASGPDEFNAHGVSEISGPVLGPIQPFFFTAYWEKICQGVKLATELRLVPKLRIIGAIPTLLPMQWLSNVTHDARLSDVDFSLERFPN